MLESFTCVCIVPPCHPAIGIAARPCHPGPGTTSPGPAPVAAYRPAGHGSLQQALARLELAFIVQRNLEHYTFCVPLFKQMVQAQDPELLLQHELRMAKT